MLRVTKRNNHILKWKTKNPILKPPLLLNMWLSIIYDNYMLCTSITEHLCIHVHFSLYCNIFMMSKIGFYIKSTFLRKSRCCNFMWHWFAKTLHVLGCIRRVALLQCFRATFYLRCATSPKPFCANRTIDIWVEFWDYAQIDFGRIRPYNGSS